MAIICSTDYHSYPMGGMMSFILDSLKLLKDDFDITLWGVKTDNNISNKIEIGKINYEIKSFSNVKTQRKIIPNIFKVIYGIWMSRKEILNENYDVIYIHGIPLTFPFFNKKVKIVNHIHGMTNPFSMASSKLARNKLSIYLYEKYRNWVVENSDLILLASDKEGHEKFSRKLIQCENKIKYLPNFADNQIFFPISELSARKELKIDKGEVVLVNTGRVSLQKDPILLIRSFIYLINILKINAKLVMIGDGELKEKIEQIISNENLESKIIITGTLSRKEINLWLNASDLYIYTSHSNGFPISLAEAAMCGLPVVTTDVTGVHDLVIKDYSGFLVKLRDPKEIAHSIQKALSKKEELGNNILAISKNFSPESVVYKMKTYILSIL